MDVASCRVRVRVDTIHHLTERLRALNKRTGAMLRRIERREEERDAVDTRLLYGGEMPPSVSSAAVASGEGDEPAPSLGDEAGVIHEHAAFVTFKVSHATSRMTSLTTRRVRDVQG